MRCLIHVGAHHSGTTSFQKLLSDQSCYLKEIGIFYPESIKEGYQHSLLPGTYLPKHYALSNNRILDIDFYIKKLKDEVEFNTCKLCFISSEVFTELLNNKKDKLLELFDKLEKIFDEVLIMYTSRNHKQKSFSAQRAQIRLSSSNTLFRSEIFNAPERFRRKLFYTKNELDRWKFLKKEIVLADMEECDMPILLYINKIIAQLDLNENSAKVHSEYFKRIIEKGNYIINEDQNKPIAYLLLILIGLKIKDEEKNLKGNLNLDLINKFINETDTKLTTYLFNITKLNVINFLENYKLSVFEENEIIDVLKKAKLTFSYRIIILKLVNDFTLKLILEGV